MALHLEGEIRAQARALEEAMLGDLASTSAKEDEAPVGAADTPIAGGGRRGCRGREGRSEQARTEKGLTLIFFRAPVGRGGETRCERADPPPPGSAPSLYFWGYFFRTFAGLALG